MRATSLLKSITQLQISGKRTGQSEVIFRNESYILHNYNRAAFFTVLGNYRAWRRWCTRYDPGKSKIHRKFQAGSKREKHRLEVD